MLGSLGWTWTTIGPVVGSRYCASLQKQEAEGVGEGSPVAAPMPKSVLPVGEYQLLRE